MNTIIEKIRAEVKIRLSANGAFDEEGDSAWHYDQGMIDAYNFILSFLSDLEKEENPIDKWSNKERKARVKKTGEIVCGFTDGQGHFDIPTDHNEFIRYDLDELEFDTLQEQPVDLDDAISNWQGIEAFPEGCGITPLPKAMKIVDKTARHFYELGRQSKPEVSEELEEVARKYRESVPVDTTIHYCGANEDVYFANRIVDAVIFGAKWQKEQMMKEAIDVTLNYTHQITLEGGEGFGKKGEHIKLIIVKEEGK